MKVILKSKLQFDINEEQAKTLSHMLIENPQKYIILNGEMFLSDDIIGIVKDSTADLAQKRFDGKWLCQWGRWHSKGDYCKCEQSVKYGEAQDCFSKEDGITNDDNVKKIEDMKKTLLIKKF